MSILVSGFKPDQPVTGNIARITNGQAIDMSGQSAGLAIQSITLRVIAGDVRVDTSGVGSGTLVPVGQTVTWAVTGDSDDSRLNNLVFTTSNPGDALVTWTTKPSPAG